jgi:hypothetical protein
MVRQALEVERVPWGTTGLERAVADVVVAGREAHGRTEPAEGCALASHVDPLGCQLGMNAGRPVRPRESRWVVWICRVREGRAGGTPRTCMIVGAMWMFLTTGATTRLRCCDRRQSGA